MLLWFWVAPAFAYDVDADGIADHVTSALEDRNCDGTFDRPGPALLSSGFSDSIRFTKIWDSDTILNNQWDADCGYFDRDSLLDLLGHHWSPNKLHVFESDGQGGYCHTWEQTESLPPGSYGALAHGDPDEDGEVELIGGDVSTLGKVVLFENVADDSWGEPHVLFTVRERLRAIRVDDTNGNDTAEIILVCGNTEGGKVLIYEHDGPPGAHSYRLVYEYSTVSYLFNGSVGDADNDGYPEILLGVGGWHGFPMYMRRIVFDPGSRTWSHHIYEHPSVIGLHLTPQVCDVDNSGGNELVVGSSGDPNGQFHVFKHVSGDTFGHLWTSTMSTEGNVVSIGAGRFTGDYPVVFAAPFSGAIYGYVKDDTAFHGVSYFATGNVVRSIDACSDRLPGDSAIDQLVLSESGIDQITVWRPVPPQALDQPDRACRPRLSVSPNPTAGRLSISCDSRITRATLYDCAGRLVADAILTVSRRPDSSNPDMNRHEARDLVAESGLYVLRCQTDRGPVSAKVIVAGLRP